MKTNFFIEMLSGENGISSKRSVMIWFVFLFSFLVIVNTFNPALKPSDTFIDQLHELVIITISLVFGEKVLEYVKQRNANKVDKKETPAP